MDISAYDQIQKYKETRSFFHANVRGLLIGTKKRRQSMSQRLDLEKKEAAPEGSLAEREQELLSEARGK